MNVTDYRLSTNVFPILAGADEGVPTSKEEVNGFPIFLALWLIVCYADNVSGDELLGLSAFVIEGEISGVRVDQVFIKKPL